MKPWYKSKTILVGTLQIVSALTAFGYEFFIEHQALDDPIKITLFINGITMVVLRFMTDKGIKTSGQASGLYVCKLGGTCGVNFNFSGMLTVLPLFLSQVEPIDVRAITNPLDAGIAIGTITILFALLFYLGKDVLSRFEKISTQNRETIKSILRDHREERDDWNAEYQKSTEKMVVLCDRMIHALAKEETK